mgnify:CR=1 FL=1
MSKSKMYEKYQLKSGKWMWHVHAYLGTDSRTGQAKYFDRRGFASKADAVQALNAAKADFQRGLDIRAGNQSPTLQQVYEEWLPTYADGNKRSTVFHAKSVWRLRIQQQLGAYYVSAITPLDCRKWINESAKKYVSVQQGRSILKQVLDDAVAMGYISHNPMQSIHLPRNRKKSNRPKINWFELDELKRFTAETERRFFLDTSPLLLSARSCAALLVIMATGCREGEIRALRWPDVDFDTGKIEIVKTMTYTETGDDVGTTKSDAGVRTVYIGGAALHVLREWRKACFAFGVMRVDNFIFAKPTNPKVTVSASTLQGEMDLIMSRLELHRITLHGLRHTKITLLSADGARIEDIAAIVGHANAQFTLSHYVHSTKPGTEAAEQKFQELISL